MLNAGLSGCINIKSSRKEVLTKNYKEGNGYVTT